MAYYYPYFSGIKTADSAGDGTTAILNLFTAYPTTQGNKVSYQIYVSTDKNLVFHEGVKFIYYGTNGKAELTNLAPGETYFFSVRPIEYPSTQDPVSVLTDMSVNLKLVPSSPLRRDMTATDLVVPLLSITDFPQSGLVLIGSEIIKYDSVNTITNDLVLSSMSNRGYNNTIVKPHAMDGNDGETTWTYRAAPRYYIIGENAQFDNIHNVTLNFEYPKDKYLEGKGYYQQTTDDLYTDLSVYEEANANFPMYDYAGWHRMDPNRVLSGDCTGSYIGGEMGCIDKDGNVNIVRGISIQDRKNQRDEALLRTRGFPCVLLQRQTTGIRCACFTTRNQQPDDRCLKCYGTGFYMGYVQIFNERESSGRINVSFDAYDDDVKRVEGGLDNEVPVSAWTLSVPIIKDRDILVRYDLAGNEEFRYEVLSVTRTAMFEQQPGKQPLKLQRIRRTDQAYRIIVFADTSKYPQWLDTSASLPGKLPVHTHKIRRNETYGYAWAQNTTKDAGHQHQVIWINGQLVVLPVLDHSHVITV